MRILLDAKDLINITEKRRPVDVTAFGDWLRAKDATAVLSFTNVSDLVGPAFATNTFLEKRVLLQALETLPLAYIREGTIIEDELRAALVAYRIGEEPAPVDPYVARWDETAKWIGEPATRILVGQRLDDFVFMARRTIQSYKTEAPGIRRYIEAERTIPAEERWSLKQMFIRRMEGRLAAHQLGTQGVDALKFGEWLWKDPRRCLGLRFHFEAHHYQVNDRRLRFGDGDIADFAHIAALPYVDLLTVDKRIDDLLQKVCRKFSKPQPYCDLSARVYRSIEAVMKAIP